MLENILLTAVPLCLGALFIAPSAKAATKADLTVTFEVTAYQNRARQALTKINALRKKEGLEPLVMLSDLEKAALQRAAELFVHFDHKRPDMTDYDTADDDYAAVRKPLVVGEIIAAGFSKADEAVDEWVGSADGKKNLLSADFTHIGIACVAVKDSYNEYYWVAYLQGYKSVKATKAAASVKAGATKKMTVEIKKTMFAKADSSHREFLLQCDDIDMRAKKTSKLTVKLADKRGVTVGVIDNNDLTLKSGDATVLTVLKDGTLRKKKQGEGSVSVKAPSLDAIKVTVDCGGAAKPDKPTLTASQTTKTVTLRCTQKAAEGFALYRSATKTGSYRKVDESKTDGKYEYKLTLTEDSKAYWYKIKSYAASGGKEVYSEYSTPVKAPK